MKGSMVEERVQMEIIIKWGQVCLCTKINFKPNFDPKANSFLPYLYFINP